MRTNAISKYYDATHTRPARDDLEFAANLITTPKIAIDCGCGAGADIHYLTQRGFTVYGFDCEAESISRCRARFKGVADVFLSQSTFTDFDYPEASLVVADASLFYCPPAEFDQVWHKIQSCLTPKGIFCGSLLGNEDSMAAPGDNPSVLWPKVTAFNEEGARAVFKSLDVLRFNTHRSSGKTPDGVTHHWHIFQIVAQKPEQ